MPTKPARPRPFITLEVIAAWCGVGLTAVLAAHFHWSGGLFLCAASAIVALWFQLWLLPRAQERRLRALAGQTCLVRYFNGPYVSLAPLEDPSRETVLPAALLRRRFGPQVRPCDTLMHQHKIIKILEMNGLQAVVQEEWPSARPEQVPLVELLRGRVTPPAWPSPQAA